jgi:hypothetical protein
MLRKTRSVLAKAAALIAHRGGRGHCGGFGGSGHMGGSAAPRPKGEEVPQRDKIKRRVVSC